MRRCIIALFFTLAMALDIDIPLRNIDCSECIDDRYDLPINGVKLEIGETVFIKVRVTKRLGW